MDRVAWQAIVHGAAESDRTEQMSTGRNKNSLLKNLQGTKKCIRNLKLNSMYENVLLDIKKFVLDFPSEKNRNNKWKKAEEITWKTTQKDNNNKIWKIQKRKSETENSERSLK